MGTRESPGHISLWLISLGQQKDAFIQFFGSDRLKKFKTADSAVLYIRAQLIDARSKSESRQDLDSKFIPINYEDLCHTSGESHSRQQFVRTPQALPQKSDFSNRMPYHRQSTYAAIDLADNEFIDQQNIADDTDYIPDQQHGNFERKNCTPNYTFKQPDSPYVTPNHPTTFVKSYTK